MTQFLGHLSLGTEKVYMPENSESRANQQAKNTNRPMLCFDVCFDEAVNESGEPKQPFQASHEHDKSNDSSIYDLRT